IASTSVNASLLFEPWTVETKTGGYYRVFTPFWKAVRDTAVGPVLPRPADLAPPEAWPESERLSDWALGAAMQRGAAVVAPHAEIGETRAHARLARFVEKAIGSYRHERDFPALPATSGLSENLTYGEISPRTVWQAGWLALREDGAEGAETFLKEIVWREFAYHLLYHTPHIRTGNWRPEWDGFAWRGDNPEAERWRRGMTGVEIVDAAMREMYVTGTMHNRARMLVASYLTKHLLTHWKIGSDWFADCLIDWDPASNAMGWQWAAGSGPDASPYFRIFNPETQAEKFDAQRQYRDRFLAEGRSRPHPDALAFFDAIPRTWKLSPRQGYPTPMIGLAEGRQRALDAYSNRPAA
ncbi:MAG: deoxyribodipyrimidine photo-lyase, partial [Pseudomonadota bacterium]